VDGPLEKLNDWRRLAGNVTDEAAFNGFFSHYDAYLHSSEWPISKTDFKDRYQTKVAIRRCPGMTDETKFSTKRSQRCSVVGNTVSKSRTSSVERCPTITPWSVKLRKAVAPC